MRLLLDAHTIVWALGQPERLPRQVQVELGRRNNQLFVSLATLWELANKVGARRLPLMGVSVERLVEAIDGLGVTFLPLARQEILSSAMLPRYHADPFDRILVAQAQAHKLTLVTKDADIGRYGVAVLWA